MTAERGSGRTVNIGAALGVAFTDRALLIEALTHPSTADALSSNQRLEWLGDRVLGLIVAERLYSEFPDENEGSLARRLAVLVSTEALAGVARSIDLGRHVEMAAGEAAGGGRDNPANLADACEALIGALYCDGGLAAARAFVERHWLPLIAEQGRPPTDPKTALQEWTQARGLGLPRYRILSTDGPDHQPTFRVSVTVDGHGSADARAGAKREAERLAAVAMLRRLLPAAADAG